MSRASYVIPDRSAGRPSVPQVLDLLGWYFASRDDVFDMGVADFLFAPNGHAQRRATIVRGTAMARHYKALKGPDGWHPDVVVAEALSAMTPTQRRKVAATVFGPRRPVKPERIVKAEARSLLAQESYREWMRKVDDFYSWKPQDIFAPSQSQGIFQAAPVGDFPSFLRGGGGESLPVLTDARLSYGAFSERGFIKLDPPSAAELKAHASADFGQFIQEHALPRAAERARKKADKWEREYHERRQLRLERGLVVKPQAARMMGPQLHVCSIGGESPRHPERHRPIAESCGGKPRGGGLWTSTWMGAERGSNWVDYFLGDVYPGWMGVLTADGLGVKGCHLLIPRADARVFHIDDWRDLDDLWRVYGAHGGVDWRAVAEDFDAVHLTSRGKKTTRRRNDVNLPTTWGWDAESTCWFHFSFASIQSLGTMYFNQARDFATRYDDGTPEVF